MKSVCIFHGWGADSSANWFPWLAAELRKKDYEVSVPDFPNTLNPDLEEWINYFGKNVVACPWRAEKHVINLKQSKGLQLQDSVLVGHSLGTPFILHLLEKYATENLQHMSGGEMVKPVYNNRIKAAFLVSVFDRSLGIPEIENFTDKPFNWEKIQNACEKFYVFHSDNDPYIPLWIAEEIAKKLNAELIIEHNGEHLNAPAGFLEYPRLLEKILLV